MSDARWVQGRVAVALGLLFLVVTGLAADELPALAGLSLPEALEQLEERGLVVIYSTALVRDDLKVRREPTSSDLRTVLEEILAEHGLGVMEGLGGQLVVVRAQEKRPPAPAQDAVEGSVPRKPVFLNEIVVTPSHFRLIDQTPESRRFLSSEQVEQTPHVADDLYRAVKRLPGAAGGDISAQFNIRGGEQRELLVILDGAVLYEPFHLKDFQSIFSIIDTEAVGGVDFLIGGFPVEYGDRMSGVMDIATSTPTGPATTTVTLGTINARLSSRGTFNEDRGQWLVNGRIWYPAKVFDLAVNTAHEILADYYDVLAKVQHDIGGSSTLSANLLLAYDDIGFTEEDERSMETVSARYRSHQEWLNLRTDWTESLFSQTVLSAGRINRHRRGGLNDQEEGTLDVHDQRQFDFYGVKQDWTWTLHDSHYLKWGVDVRRERAVYDYSRLSVASVMSNDQSEVTAVQVDAKPSGSSYSAYLADRFRLTEPLVVELGLRWDRQFYINEHQLSPRINLIYDAGPRTTVRAAWGRFYQSQRINELQVEDGVTDYSPAQLAEHSMLSLDHRFSGELAVRLEIYNKELSRLRPRFENIFNPIELFSEAAFDRVQIAAESGRLRGLEILLRKDSDRDLDWWVSYSLARAEDSIDGRDVPRYWDQRHAVGFGINWDLPRGWSLNLAGNYHSGWPVTEVTAMPVEGEGGTLVYELVTSTRNQSRLPPYLRLDLRVSRSFATSHGLLRVYFEVLNLTNRQNVCCRDDFKVITEEDGSADVVYKESFWAPIIPSLAVSWTF